MNCLSKDGERIVDTNKFYIEIVPSVLASHQGDNVTDLHKVNYAITADSVIMEIFDTKEKAKTKLLDVLKALSENNSVFEF